MPSSAPTFAANTSSPWDELHKLPQPPVAHRRRICNTAVTCMSGEVVQIQRRAALEAQTASLWRALADPTRRQILDLLTERPRITGEIASHFAISRIAVMRHLEVLAAAELITSRKRGRERWHYLNAVPIQRLHERWTT